MKIIFISFTIFCFLYASDKDTIVWLENDAPPFYIQNGKFKDNGIGDIIQEMVIKNMNNYTHEIKLTTLNRAIEDFKHEKKVCFSTWIHDSTPDYTITSIPNVYYPPLGIITRVENKKMFGKLPISLDKLMANKNFVFIQGVGRGYGNPLDEIVNKYRDENNFKVRSSSINITTSIFEMIKRKRVDYTIDYYSSLKYFEEMTEKNDNLIFLPIKENLDDGVLGSIACTKSIWGEKVIEDINKVIEKIKLRDDYKETLKMWLVPKESSKEYWNNYKNRVENHK